MKQKFFAALAAGALLSGALAGCAAKPSDSSSAVSAGSSTAASPTGTVVMRGSSALYPLMQLAVEPFMNKFPGYNGNVDTGAGEGSGAGLDALIAGTGGCNIGNSDVTAEQAGKDATGLVDHQVAVVAVAVVVSPDVKAKFGSKGIKLSDVLAIYNGSVTNWKDVANAGGYDKAITVCYRKKGSGTRTLFQSYGIVGTKFNETKAPFTGNAFKYTNASSDLSSVISSGTGAIGYESLPYCGKLDKLPIVFDLDSKGAKLANASDAGVACSYQNVDNGTYKIWGYEHMYTKGTPSDGSAVQAFILFVSSADFQPTILQKGYGLVSSLTSAAKTGH